MALVKSTVSKDFHKQYSPEQAQFWKYLSICMDEI